MKGANTKLAVDAHAKSKRNYEKGVGKTGHAKRYGCYVVALYTLLGSFPDTATIKALEAEYCISVLQIQEQAEKTKDEM